jgi:SOS-response transcriptional repressor LexA
MRDYMNSDDSASRIRQLRDALELSQSSFATGLGIPRTTLINYEKKTSIPAETLSILKAKYAVNIDWFLTGEGSMFIKTPDLSGANEIVSYQPENDERTVEQYRLSGRNAVEMAVLKMDPDIAFVDFYPQTIGAGPGHEAEAYLEATRLPVMRKFLAPWRPDQIRALEARGDSMTKIGLFDRDVVLYVPEETEGDGVFVISIDNRMQVKRIEFDILGEALKIISENDRYEPRTLAGSTEVKRVKIEGKVVGWLHRHPY